MPDLDSTPPSRVKSRVGFENSWAGLRWDLTAALLLFLPTLGGLPHELHLVPLAFVVLTRRVPVLPRDAILVAFVACAFAMLPFSWDSSAESEGLRSMGVILMIPTALVGRALPRGTCQILVLLIAVEGLVCCYEAAASVPYLWSGQQTLDLGVDWGVSELQYFNRVIGLSDNSSTCAQKLLLALLLLDRHPLRGWLRNAVLATLVLGLYFTFNRTTLLALALFLLLRFGTRLIGRAGARRALAAWVVLVAVGFVAAIEWESIELQFSRGISADVPEDTGRSEIRKDSWNFFVSHPIFGNYGRMFMSTAFAEAGKQGHVHNSFLQMMCNYGAVSLMLFAFAFSQIRPFNVRYVLALVVYSMGQYGLFWNVSLLDITLYHLLHWNPGKVRLMEAGHKSGGVRWSLSNSRAAPVRAES